MSSDCESFRRKSFLFSVSAGRGEIRHAPRGLGDPYPYLIELDAVQRIVKFTDREEGGAPPIFDTNITPAELVCQWGQTKEGCCVGRRGCSFHDLPPNGVLTHVVCGKSSPISMGIILQNATLVRRRRRCFGNLLFRASIRTTNGARARNQCIDSVSLFIDNSTPPDQVWSTGPLLSVPMSFVTLGGTWTMDSPTNPAVAVANGVVTILPGASQLSSTVDSSVTGVADFTVVQGGTFWVDLFHYLNITPSVWAPDGNLEITFRLKDTTTILLGEIVVDVTENVTQAIGSQKGTFLQNGTVDIIEVNFENSTQTPVNLLFPCPNGLTIHADTTTVQAWLAPLPILDLMIPSPFTAPFTTITGRNGRPGTWTIRHGCSGDISNECGWPVGANIENGTITIPPKPATEMSPAGLFCATEYPFTVSMAINSPDSEFYIGEFFYVTTNDPTPNATVTVKCYARIGPGLVVAKKSFKVNTASTNRQKFGGSSDTGRFSWMLPPSSNVVPPSTAVIEYVVLEFVNESSKPAVFSFSNGWSIYPVTGTFL